MVHFMPKSSGNQEIVIKSSWNIYKCIIQRTHLLFCVLHSNWRVVSFYSVNQDKRQVCMYIVFWYVTILCFCSGPWWYESMRIVLFGKILFGKKEILCGLKSQLNNCESLDLFYAELKAQFSKNYWSLQKLQNVTISDFRGNVILEHTGSGY